MKHPSAWLPVAMSCVALAIVGGHVAIYGAARETDEGALAHIWQLLMALQVPVVVLFAAKWVRPQPRLAVQILALQVVAAVAAIAPVWYFGL